MIKVWHNLEKLLEQLKDESRITKGRLKTILINHCCMHPLDSEYFVGTINIIVFFFF